MDRAFQRIRSLMLRGTFYSVPPNTMNKIEEIKKKIRDLKLKQKMTTGRLEWNDIQREIDILNNELKQLETDKPQYGK